ncbi:hypothetical protein Tco_1116857, partial [Tanacetum coccineum]
MTNSEIESDKEASPEINAGTLDKGQAGLNPGEQDEGQAGPNPGIQDEGQDRSNPGDAAESQPQSSHVVYAGPNLEHMDFEVTNASTQQNPEQIDEEFTTMAYPSVQENLKLPTNDQEDEPNKSNTEVEVQSMVTVPIHQDTSLVPLMTTPVINLTMSQPVSTTVQAPLPTSTTTVTAITTTIPPTPQPQQSTTDLILVRRIGELEQHMTDLLQDNLAIGERLDKYGTRLYNLEKLNIPHKKSLELEYSNQCLAYWKRISEKRTKNQAKTDKTEDEMEKSEKAKVNPAKSQQSREKAKVNPDKVKAKKTS